MIIWPTFYHGLKMAKSWQNDIVLGFTGWSKLKERVLQYDFMIIDRKFYFYPLFNWLRNIKNFIYSVSSRSNNEFYIRGIIPTHIIG